MNALLPKLQEWHYLNYAGTGPLLAPSIRLLQEMAEESAQPLFVHRDKWLARMKRTRECVARLIGAQVDAIALAPSTTAALNWVAHSIGWKAGDRVVYPADEFPSNRFVWDNLRGKGVETVAVEPEAGRTFLEQLAALDVSRVRLVTLSLVSYWDGRVQEVAPLVRFCHEKGIRVLVDAIQAIGAIPFSVAEAGCDFLACGGQKWLFGPLGTGFLYIRPAILEELFVSNVGWASVESPGEYEEKTLSFAPGASRFEGGGRNVAALCALGRSIEALEEVGWDRIYRAVADWNGVLRRRLQELGWTPLAAGTASGIVALKLGNKGMADRLREWFQNNRVVAVQRGDYLRVSAHFFTKADDIETLINGIRILK